MSIVNIYKKKSSLKFHENRLYVPLKIVRQSLAQMIMRKNNVLSANKRSNKLHTAVSVAFSYLHQCRVKTGGFPSK